MAPSSRLAVRFAQLPHDALAELAAQLCADGGLLAAAQAEDVLAAHQPVPQWAVEGVLLSSDLVPHVLAHLELEDGAAAAACSAWLVGWRATAQGRRRLRQVPFELPENMPPCAIAAIPGNDERLAVLTTGPSTTHILDRSMNILGEFEFDGTLYVANEHSLFMVSTSGGELHRCSHTGAVLATYEEDDEEEGSRSYSYLVLAPGGLLFCVSYADGQTDEDELLALDADTLQLRYRFGRSLVNLACEMAVLGHGRVEEAR